MGKTSRRKHKTPNQNGQRKRRMLHEIDLGETEVLDTSEDEHGIRKADLINEALKNLENQEMANPSNELRLLALQDGGFLWDKTLRKKCWLKLLDARDVPQTSQISQSPLRDDTARQIDLDVARSYGNVGVGGAEKRAKLRSALRLFFMLNPSLHYYQGFHDVFVVLMDVISDQAELMQSAWVVSNNFYFQDAHAPDFRFVEGALRTVVELVHMTDSELAPFVEQSPFWGVSMLLTGFAHDVESRLARLRLFDALLASPPYFQLYLVAALPMLPDVRVAIKTAEDYAHVHEAIRNGARQIKTIRGADLLVRTARGLLEKVPPAQLLVCAENLGFLPRSSCLFRPFKFDQRWVPPEPQPNLPFAVPKWTASLAGPRRIMRFAMANRFWAIAFVVIVTAYAFHANGGSKVFNKGG